MSKPTRADLDKLRIDLDDWQKRSQPKGVVAGQDLGPAQYSPEPSEFVPRVQSILDEVRGQGDYRVLEGFVSDPDSVEIIDVLRDLGDAKPFLPE
jgi:hypothetical protein